MKAFLAGIALVLVLGVLTAIGYDWAAIDSAEGFTGRSSVHLAETDRAGR